MEAATSKVQLGHLFIICFMRACSGFFWFIIFFYARLQPRIIIVKFAASIIRSRLYWFYSHFLLSGYFYIRWVWDAIRVPNLVDFGFKNCPTSALGRLLERLVGVLAASWAVLEASWGILRRHWKMMQKKKAKKPAETGVWRRLGGVLAASWAILRNFSPVNAAS